MTGQFAPERQPITEQVPGAVTRVGDHVLFSGHDLGVGELIARGDLVIRYGITYLGKPHLSIVPDLVVADYGERLAGEAAWQFLMDQGHLYPRADVCGMRNDGQMDMQSLKLLDLDYPYDVLVYQEASRQQPIAKLNALIAADVSGYPARLLEHLPCFDNLDELRANE